MQTFYVAVWNYATLVLLVKTTAEKVPEPRDEIEVDFGSLGTEFIEGEWGVESACGSFSFPVTGHSLSVKEWDGLPVVESQLAYDNA